jgi:hypothetical protein
MKILKSKLLRDNSPPKTLCIFNQKSYTMKSFSLCLSFIASFIVCNAQLDKGTWMVGGSGSFYSYNEAYTLPLLPASNYNGKATNIDVSASVGYFIADKFVGGLRSSFSSYKEDNGAGGSTNSYRLAIGPFARYYFLKDDKQFNLLTDIGYQFGLYQMLGALHEKGKNNIFSAMGGTEIFFNGTAGMEILLGYAQQILSIENSPNGFNYKKSGLQVSIGFTLHLEKL